MGAEIRLWKLYSGKESLAEKRGLKRVREWVGKLCGRIVETKGTVKITQQPIGGLGQGRVRELGWSRAITERFSSWWTQSQNRARPCRHWKKFGFNSRWSWELLEGFEDRNGVIWFVWRDLPGCRVEIHWDWSKIKQENLPGGHLRGPDRRWWWFYQSDSSGGGEKGVRFWRYL